MKKIILSAAALLAFGFTNAQDAEAGDAKGFRKGDVYISGNIGFSSVKTGDQKTNSFELSPQVGFFVSDNFAIGGVVAYTSSTSDQYIEPIADVTELKTNAFAIGAFGRYYTTPASDFSFFGELGLAYVTAKSEYTAFDDSESTANGFTMALSPGVSYFISKNFALEASIGALSYSTIKPDFEGADSTDTFELNLDLTNITFGFVYKF